MLNYTSHESVGAVHIEREIWKAIKDYPNYEVSNYGRVKNKNKIMKPYKTNNGYLHIFLSKNGRQKQFLLHRLVANIFIDNPNHLKEVNHIDGNKENNRIDNLEWCTRKQNVHHYFCSKEKNDTKAKKVVQYDLKGNIIKTFESIRKASKETNIDAHYIIYCCKGAKDRTANYIWKYEIA